MGSANYQFFYFAEKDIWFQKSYVFEAFSSLQLYFQFTIIIVQLLSCIWLLQMPWTAVSQAFVSFTVSEFAQTHVHWVSDAIQPSHPLSPPSPPAPSFPVSHSFPMLPLCVRWPEYWSSSFSISPSNEYLGWFPLGLTGLILRVQGTLKSLLQHHNSKASILQCSALFMV